MRKHHYRSLSKEPPELDITTFLNLMVVLVPFLLITAVFSRITIMELNLPSGASGNADKPKITVEVIIRNKGIEISNGQSVIASFAKKDEKYNIEELSINLQKIKQNYPDKKDATILIEDDIAYDAMIQVMDAVRVVEIRNPDVLGADGQPELQKAELFPDMSIGEAP
jgi:biopolymer transport protein ExbD